MTATASSRETNQSRRDWSGGLHDGRRRKPADVPELLVALARIREEAQSMAERAYEAIQHHAYDPYRQFCEKRIEHEALLSVVRNRIGPKTDHPEWPKAADAHDHALLILSIQACLKFAFALSATPLMPIGAREIFVNELEMLRGAQARLQPIKEQEGISNLLDELDMALMILEEVVNRAPALEEF